MVATRAAKDTPTREPERRSSSRIKEHAAAATTAKPPPTLPLEAIAPTPEVIEMTDAEIEASLLHTDELEPEVKNALVTLRRQTLRPIDPREYALPFTPEEIKSIGLRKVVRHPPPYKRISKSIILSTTLPLADLPVHKCDCFELKTAASTTRRAKQPEPQEEPEPHAKTRSKKITKAQRPPKAVELYCGEDCHNRMLFISCSPETCSAPDPALCTNRAIMRRETKPVRVEYVEGPGFGLFAEETIEPGEFIIEYVGEMIDDEECERRLLKYRDLGEEHFYMLEIEKDVVIDARYRSNEARFINHSCDSNSMTQKWNVDSVLRIGIFARRRIPPNEEITIDYNFSHFGDPMDCKCGSAACTGKLGLKRSDVQLTNARATIHTSTSKKAQELLLLEAPPPEVKRPVLVSSLALLKSATMDMTWLDLHGFKKRRLFPSSSSSSKTSAPSSLTSSPSAWSTATEEDVVKAPTPTPGDWYARCQRGEHLANMRAVQSYLCGGTHDWTSALAKNIKTNTNTKTANKSRRADNKNATKTPTPTPAKMVRKRVSLVAARARFFADLRSFATGASTWNARVPTSATMDPDRIFRFIDNMKSGKQFLIQNQNDLNEDTCHRCGLAGELLCCDGCPAAFHLNCTNLATVPSEGEPWFCSDCKRSTRQRTHMNGSEAPTGAASVSDDGGRSLRHHAHAAPVGPSLKRIFHAQSTKDVAVKKRPRKRMKTTDKSYRLLEQMPLPTWDFDDEE